MCGDRCFENEAKRELQSQNLVGKKLNLTEKQTAKENVLIMMRNCCTVLTEPTGGPWARAPDVCKAPAHRKKHRGTTRRALGRVHLQQMSTAVIDTHRHIWTTHLLIRLRHVGKLLFRNSQFRTISAIPFLRTQLGTNPTGHSCT